MIGAAELALLPQGAFVINTARGGLIDEAALHARARGRACRRRRARRVRGRAAGRRTTRCAGIPKVIATPHVAGVTDGSLVNMGVMAAECIVAVLQGRPVPEGRLVVG